MTPPALKARVQFRTVREAPDHVLSNPGRWSGWRHTFEGVAVGMFLPEWCSLCEGVQSAPDIPTPAWVTAREALVEHGVVIFFRPSAHAAHGGRGVGWDFAGTVYAESESEMVRGIPAERSFTW